MYLCISHTNSRVQIDDQDMKEYKRMAKNGRVIDLYADDFKTSSIGDTVRQAIGY